MAPQKNLLALAALACLVAVVYAQSLDDELEAVFRSRRTAQGVMRGYAGISRHGNPLAFAGGYAASTRYVPRYVARPSNVEVEEVEPENDEEEPMEDEEEPMEDEEEEVEEQEDPAPVKFNIGSRGYPARPTAGKPTRPQKPVQEEDEDEEGVNPGYGGVTAIATSVSRGQGANSRSQAIAYGSRLSRGQYRHRY